MKRALRIMAWGIAELALVAAAGGLLWAFWYPVKAWGVR